MFTVGREWRATVCWGELGPDLPPKRHMTSKNSIFLFLISIFCIICVFLLLSLSRTFRTPRQWKKIKVSGRNIFTITTHPLKSKIKRVAGLILPQKGKTLHFMAIGILQHRVLLLVPLPCFILLLINVTVPVLSWIFHDTYSNSSINYCHMCLYKFQTM